jgi:hypothetical protein
VAHCAAFRAGFVVWHLSRHRQQRRTYGKERKKGARVKTTAPPVLSSTAQKVTRRTITGANASYSLKPAESLSRGAHTRRGAKALLGASRSLSALISAAYGSGRQLRAPKSGKLRAPKGKELRAPKSGKLRAPKGKELRAPKSGKNCAHLRGKNCAHLRKNCAHLRTART